MISFLTGKIINKENQTLTILTASGVGYGVHVAPVLYLESDLDSDTSLYTYLAVRENAMDLYGFKDLSQRNLFMKFLDVSGIGPKSALHLLSLGTVEEISAAIARGDSAYLTKVSGVGKKTAERIVVDLRSKMSDFTSDSEDQTGESLGEVIDALVSLGYSKEEARMIVKTLDTKDKTSEQLVKEALKMMK
ncbi:MAG TPA: Holliday junction branch migration protein RuvA [Candidatus Magasanikbacteria bacterium]|nr:Holliday junction branch migration protein RuvA [Candidatus Magasanikbacteria bacterium]